MFRFQLRQDSDNRTPLDRLDNLLKTIAGELPSYDKLIEKQQPIFSLTRLIVYGHCCVLESLFQWFVMHTKEKRHFHIIMASSDSFFNLWLEKFIGSSRYNTYVLGHLNKAESSKYWEAKIASDSHLLKQRSFKPPKFEDVFSACGGCIFLMNLYWDIVLWLITRYSL